MFIVLLIDILKDKIKNIFLTENKLEFIEKYANVRNEIASKPHNSLTVP